MFHIKRDWRDWSEHNARSWTEFWMGKKQTKSYNQDHWWHLNLDCIYEYCINAKLPKLIMVFVIMEKIVFVFRNTLSVKYLGADRQNACNLLGRDNPRIKKKINMYINR